jgi:hypothetical protein
MSAPAESPAPRAASAAGVSVAVIGGASSYAMFDVVSLEGLTVKVRGPVLLEVTEEVPMRFSRNGASVDVRARVLGHDRSGGGVVTELALVDGETELRRLLGS